MPEIDESAEVEEVGLIVKLARGAGSLLGIGTSEVKGLEERIQDVAKTEKMKISRDSLPEWGLLVYDFNRLHWLRETAEKMGFEDTPVHGSRIAAHAEQYVLGLVRTINSINTHNFTYDGHGIRFKQPLYPGKTAKWNLTKVVLDEEAKSIGLDISAIDSDGTTIVDCPGVRLSLERERPEIEEVIPFSSEDVIRKRISVTPNELTSYYRILGKEENNGGIPMMYPASFIVAALLEAVSTRTGKPEGGFLGMDLVFHHQPRFGPDGEPAVINTSVIASPPRERRGKYFYDFQALCSQEGEPVLSGKVRAYVEYELGNGTKAPELSGS